MSSPIKISLQQARNMAVNCQLLDGNTKIKKGKAGVVQIIEHLGYIQVDTIAVIERAHHHTIWTRVPSYRPDMLDELLAKDRKVFEYWGHAASYLPMKDYRFYLPKMRLNLSEHPRWQKWAANNKKLLDQVLKRIQREGPLGASDFTDTRKKKRGTWWDWKPAKTALETLHTTGDLMVCARRKFERVFDLTERVLPKCIVTMVPNQDDVVQFAVHRALKAHGLVTARQILNHILIVKEKMLKQYLADMAIMNKIIKVRINGINNEYYTNHETIDLFEDRPKKKVLHILSPFDNFIIQRDRIKRLFDFDYQLECYKHPKQRIYGYFVLPILWENEFIGRIDLKADRVNKELIVRNLLFEYSKKQIKDILPALAEKLKELAAFNKVEQVIIKQTNLKSLKTSLNKIL